MAESAHKSAAPRKQTTKPTPLLLSTSRSLLSNRSITLSTIRLKKAKMSRQAALEAYFANRARPVGPRSLPDTNQPVDVPHIPTNATRPVASETTATPTDTTGTAAAALPSIENVASLFANAFQPTGNTARTSISNSVDPLLSNNKRQVVVDPPSTALLANHTNQFDSQSETARLGNSTLAIQQLLTTSNVRSLDHSTNRRVITIDGDHSNHQSKTPTNKPGKSTRSAKPTLVGPGEFKRGGGEKKLQPADGIPLTNSSGVPRAILASASSQQHPSDGNATGTGGQKSPDSGEKHWSEDLADPHQRLEPLNNLVTNPTPGSGATPPKLIADVPSPTGSLQFSSPTSSEYRRQGLAKSRRTSTSGQHLDERLTGVQTVSLRGIDPSGEIATGQISSNRSIAPAPSGLLSTSEPSPPLSLKSAHKILSLMFNKIEQVVDGNGQQVITKVSSSLSAATISQTASLDSLSLTAQSNHKSLSDISTEFIRLFKALHALPTVKELHNTLVASETRLLQTLETSQDAVIAQPNYESPFSNATPQQASTTSTLDSALVQLLVENTMSKYSSRFESMLTASLHNASPNCTSEVSGQEDLEQKMEEHSKRQRRDFAKLSDKIDRAMGQFRSGEARMREEMTSLADTIRTSRVQVSALETAKTAQNSEKYVCFSISQILNNLSVL
ncbi:hypothetical protein MJO28_017906 [Puccinia striiformis f. sp. tritici]|nr:hypothetical protein MJO28_017906 [Puccinia striiformis f. sp. tritici]